MKQVTLLFIPFYLNLDLDITPIIGNISSNPIVTSDTPLDQTSSTSSDFDLLTSQIRNPIANENYTSFKIYSNCASFDHEEVECTVEKMPNVEKKIDQLHEMVKMYMLELSEVNEAPKGKGKTEDTSKEMEVTDKMLEKLEENEEKEKNKEPKIDLFQEVVTKGVLNQEIDSLYSSSAEISFPKVSEPPKTLDQLHKEMKMLEDSHKKLELNEHNSMEVLDLPMKAIDPIENPDLNKKEEESPKVVENLLNDLLDFVIAIYD